MGIRFPKRAVRPAPNLAMASFQHKKDKTELPRPRYNTINNKELLHVIGGIDAVFVSMIKAGNKRIVPDKKVIKMKLIGLIPGGFFRTRIL